MRNAMLFCVLVLCVGCVAEPHRRLNEGNRKRGADIAANKEAPPDVRKKGAEIEAASAQLQEQAVPKPDTPVEGTTEELQKDLASAAAYDRVIIAIKGFGETVLAAATAKWAWIGTVIGGIATAGALWKKHRATVMAVASKGAELLASREKDKAVETVGVLARGIADGKPLVDILKDEAKSLVNVDATEIAKAVEDAKAGKI